MIRINLLPTAKRSSRRATSSSSSRTIAIAVSGLVGWIITGSILYFTLDSVHQEAEALRISTAKNKKRSEEIRKLIDEEGLKARQAKVEQLRAAINKLEAQRRTPVFVMHEVANILSTGRLPDIDQEKQRKIESFDPQAKLNPSWDATSVWLSEFSEQDGNKIKFAGSARDPADLDEFIKRLRSSARFTSVSHPEFVAKDMSKSRSSVSTSGRHYSFTMTAVVSYWD